MILNHGTMLASSKEIKNQVQFFTYRGFNPLPSYGLGLSLYDKVHVKASIGFAFVFGFNAGIFYNHRLDPTHSIYVGINYVGLNAMTVSYVGSLLTAGYKYNNFSVELGAGLYKSSRQSNCEPDTSNCDSAAKLKPAVLASAYWWSI